MYANADVYLLDDPLSAVDAHVGRQLMTECICGVLRGKTRILVTHQLQFLPEADQVVMMEDGAIAHTGTYAELVEQGVTFAEFQMRQGGEEGARGAASTARARAARPRAVLAAM